MAIQNDTAPAPPQQTTAMKQQQKPWVETPLKESSALSKAVGCRVFLKMENLQPSGSFKSRGIGHYLLTQLSTLSPSSNPHIFSSSGGNAGLASVHASRALSLPCTVVVPFSTSALMVSKIRTAGAHAVIQHGATWADADAYLREIVMPTQHRLSGEVGIYTPPFDHVDIWTGNATVVSEIVNQLQGVRPSIIICSVGGGGLFNGVMQGLDTLGWGHTTTVLALETAGAASLSASLAAGHLITLPGITSRATSLGATRVTAKTLEYAQRENVKSVVLEDHEAAEGCVMLADEERVMVELACGVNVGLLLKGRIERVLGRTVDKEERLVVVVCGGSGVTVEMLAGWREEVTEVGALPNGNGHEA